MNIIFLRKSVFSLTLVTVALLSGGLSASAQTAEETSNGVEQFSASFSNDSEEFILSVDPQLLTTQTVSQASENSAPVPGTSATSSALLGDRNPESNVLNRSSKLKPSISSDVAQADIDFGGTTRGGSSYVGIAGNLGLGGDSALGDGNFMVISKVGITDILSIRPSVVLGDDTVILAPVTYDFSFNQVADPFSEALPFSPYVGAGVALATGDASELSFLITGGVDVPLSDKLTATAAVNAAFFDDTDLGLSVGVGYNFGGF